MKKPIIFAVILTLIFSFNVYAGNPAEGFKTAMETEYNNFRMVMDISAELIEPLSENFDTDGEITKMLTSAATCDMTVLGNGEGTQMTSVGVVNVSAGGENTEMQMWLDLDMTDDVRYIAIMKYLNIPEEDKYMIMDYTKLPGFEDVLANQGTEPVNATKMQAELFDGIEEINPVYKNGKYTVTLTENQIKESLSQLLSNAAAISGNMTADMADIEETAEKLQNIDLFDKKEAMVFELTTDEENRAEKMSMEINVDANAAEISEAVGEDLPEGLKKEDCDIKARILMNLTLEEITEDCRIELPEITEENSIDILEMSENGAAIDETAMNIMYNGSLIKFEEKPILEENRTFLPIRKLANTFGIPDEDISFDGKTRKVNIKYGENELELTIGSNVATVNGEEKILDVPAFIREDRTYVPLRFISESFGKTVEWIPLEDGEGNKTGGSLIILADE